MQAVTSEWISLTVGVPGRRPLALTPPLPPLPEASVYYPDHLAFLSRPSPSLSLSLPHSSWSGRSTPYSVVSPLALPAPHRAYSPVPGAQASLHVNGDGGSHRPPPGFPQGSFSQPLLGSPDRVISELSNAFSSQGPWREESRQFERKAEREAGERRLGGPTISKKSCLKPSDVVRCLSTEQRLPDLCTPEESQPSQALGSPFPGRGAEQTEPRSGGEQAERKAARSGVRQVGLQHDACAGASPWAGSPDDSPTVRLPGHVMPGRPTCLSWEQKCPGGNRGAFDEGVRAGKSVAEDRLYLRGFQSDPPLGAAPACGTSPWEGRKGGLPRPIPAVRSPRLARTNS